MGWPICEREDFEVGAKRTFWGREFTWNGREWEPTEGGAKAGPERKAEPKAAEKPSEPEAKKADAKPSEEATILDKYKLKITGPGHEKLAKAVEKGITAAADLCDINPPICKGNLGLTRDKMPQFPNDDVRDKFLDDMRKRGVRVSTGKMKVGQLRASQEEIQAKKTVGMVGSYLDGKFPQIKNAIVVSKDGYIVDGHHRWAALLTVSPGEEMNVIRVGVPIKALLSMVNEAPGVERRNLQAASIGHEKAEEIAALDRVLAIIEGKVVPFSAYKLTVLDDREGAIAKQIEDGIKRSADLCKIMPPVCVGNLGIPRAQMPQLDEAAQGRLFERLKRKGVKFVERRISVGRLKATQGEIYAPMVLSMLGRLRTGKYDPEVGKRLLVSRDNYILDGHHRWAAAAIRDPGAALAAVQIDLPIRDLLSEVGEVSGVERRSLSTFRHAVGEELSSQDRRALRKGDRVTADARRGIVKVPGRGDLIRPFKGPAKLTGPYLGWGSIPHYLMGPDAPLRGTPPEVTGTAIKVGYRDSVVLIPAEDVLERHRAGSVAAEAMLADRRLGAALSPQAGYRAGVTDRMASGRHKQPKNGSPKPFARMFERLALTAFPAPTSHGVGTSPSASPADREAGRFQNQADGPVIVRRKPGYKPMRAGAGRMVPGVVTRP